MKGGMTVINIEIYNRQIRLDPARRESLLDQRVERTSEFKRAITTQKVQYNPVTDINVDEFILEKMITDFSECAIYNALGELDYWFSFSKGVMIDPGYKALAYRALYGRDKKPDTSESEGPSEFSIKALGVAIFSLWTAFGIAVGHKDQVYWAQNVRKLEQIVKQC